MIKNNLKILIIILNILLVLIYLAGCSNDLTREKAFDLINKSFPISVYGRIWLFKNKHISQQEYNSMNQLANEGFVKVITQRDYFGNLVGSLIALDKLNKYLVPPNERKMVGDMNPLTTDVVYVCLAKRSMQSITGIRKDEKSNSAGVEFDYKLIDFTPLWKFALDRNGMVRGVTQEPSEFDQRKNTYQGGAVFKLYDDGWRLESLLGPFGWLMSSNLKY